MNKDRQRDAFSLVELLAVVAIILILLMLLIPLATEIKHRAKLPGCFQNMRSIAIAYTQHCVNNDGKTPGPNWGVLWASWGQQHGWLYGDQTEFDKVEDVKSGQLWPYMQDIRSFRCPADKQPIPASDPTFPNYPFNTRLLTSYVANGSTAGYPGGPAEYPGYDATTKLFNTFKISQFRPNDVMYWEPDERDGGGSSWGDWWDGGNTPNQDMTRRHGPARSSSTPDPLREKGVMGCNDGHAEIILRDEFNKMGAANIRNRVWNSPDTANGR